MIGKIYFSDKKFSFSTKEIKKAVDTVTNPKSEKPFVETIKKLSDM